jgi:hypothetical protein
VGGGEGQERGVGVVAVHPGWRKLVEERRRERGRPTIPENIWRECNKIWRVKNA